MSDSLKIALAQLDFKVGDIAANTALILQTAKRLQGEADLVLFPELCLTGYPPEDLLLKPGFHRQVQAALEQIAAAVNLPALVLGYPFVQGQQCFNSAGVFFAGKRHWQYHKQALPNYGVFDEKRYFDAGHEACVFEYKGWKLGLTICEDIWSPEAAQKACEQGAELILNLNASPFHLGKTYEREQVVQRLSADLGVPVLYCNLTGAQDELVFDGASFVSDARGQLCHRSVSFAQASDVICVNKNTNARAEIADSMVNPVPETEAAVYQALVMGVRDYVRKNGFSGVVIGLSGGIDSAITLCIAVDALGAENVEAVMLPSPYTSQMSLDDAAQLAANLQVEYHIISIEKPFQAFMQTLEKEFTGLAQDVTEENIQARCRGTILMAISNKKGKMLLSTGNKSEMAVGYSTLYGDMAGGFDVLKDVSKTLVFAISRYRNTLSAVIPQRIITRPPSAELRPDQKDEDSLPAYEILDAILERLVERDQSADEIIKAGFDAETVHWVARQVYRNEYKRRQAAPGVKISPRAFGKDRRYPIVSGYVEA